MLTLFWIFVRFQSPSISTPLVLKSPKTNQFSFALRLNFVRNFIAIGWTLRPAAHPQNCDTYPPPYIITYIYINLWMGGGSKSTSFYGLPQGFLLIYGMFKLFSLKSFFLKDRSTKQVSIWNFKIVSYSTYMWCVLKIENIIFW